MNNELFHQANAMVAAKDYDTALRLYSSCLGDEAGLEPGEMGLLHHRRGNCLIKMKRYAEAIEAYAQATADAAYDAAGAVNYNNGMAHAALHDFDEAVRHFEIAISNRSYSTPYKAYLAMGNVLLKQGKSAEAGVAFREAALDDANPDPTKALLNLGVCFMALNRPADAVASYESALQFDMQQATRNKLYASLGQAYTACGQMQKAVDAFEQSIADRTYFLTSSATVDYQRAVAAVSQGTAEVTQALPVLGGADISGLDVSVSAASAFPDVEPAPEQRSQNDPYYYADNYDDHAYESSEERFFSATDEELEQWSKGVARQRRKGRGVGLKILIALIVLLAALLSAGIVLYIQGFGWPTQEAVAQQLFENPDGASGAFASSVSSSDAQAMASLVASGTAVKVDGVDRAAASSTAYVTVTPKDGADVQYKVGMVRDGIGWKISSVELYFASQN
ncbi:tetratricopeptide repeat protein [Eggerthellaceae bacterium zg-997]|nr:tetratricopeptide repeat protein [Eggerthellaceae bacterium zg-997]